MNRKLLYGLLATPVLLLLLGFLILPGPTKMFLYEFKHNIAAMLGYEPEPITGADGSGGLRLEHPEEYGMPEGEEADSEGSVFEEDTPLGEEATAPPEGAEKPDEGAASE